MNNSSDNLAISLELIRESGINVDEDIKIYNGTYCPIMMNREDENYFGLDGMSGY